jgi:hypothetical protein
MTEVSTYLDNTLLLTSLLDTNKAYNNMNLSMERELDYYNDIVLQLNNTQSKINKTYFSSYINTIDTSALLQLFQILTIIIAGTATTFVLTEDIDNSSLKNWIAGIAGTLSVFAFVIYMLEISSRVRTDPTKIYWAEPNKKVFG